MKEKILLASAGKEDAERLRSALGETTETGTAENAVELFAEGVSGQWDVLIVDEELPMLHGTKEISWLKREGKAACLILLKAQQPGGAVPEKESLELADGILVRPLAERNILPCILMAVSRADQKRQIQEEYDQMRHAFLKDRAEEYLKRQFGRTYGMTEEEAKERAKALFLQHFGNSDLKAEEMSMLYYDIVSEK